MRFSRSSPKMLRKAPCREALIRKMAALSRDRGIPFVFLVLDPTDERILDALREYPGLHIPDVSRRSTAFHPNEGHPAPA